MTVVHGVRLACERADAPTLRTLLSADVVALIDTGGDLIAPTRPVEGVAAVAEVLLGTLADADLSEQQVNGLSALVGRRAGRVIAIVSLEVVDSVVATLWITLSPLKLQRWNS